MKEVKCDHCNVEFSTVWAVHDSGENGVVGDPIRFFLEETEARENGSKAGWWGSNCHVSQQTCVIIGDNYYLLASTKGVPISLFLDEEQKSKIRVVALQKLTQTEKTLLGLD